MRKRFRMEYDSRKKGIRLPLLPEPDSVNYRQPLFVYDQLAFLEPILEKENEILQDSCLTELKTDVTEESNGEAEDGEVVTLASDDVDVVSVSESSDKSKTFCEVEFAGNDSCHQAPNTDGPSKCYRSVSSGILKSSILACKSRKRRIDSVSPPPSLIPSAPQLRCEECSTPATGPAPPPLTSSMDFPAFFQIIKTVYDHVQKEMENEECKLMGRQVALDCRRLDAPSFAIARYRINKLIMELELHQSESGASTS